METKERKGFTWLNSFNKQINKIAGKDEKAANALARAIYTYGITRTEPVFEDDEFIAEVVWDGIKPVLDEQWILFENGSKGGAPTGNNNRAKSTKNQPKNNQTLTKNQPKNNQNQPNPSREEEEEEEEEMKEEEECLSSRAREWTDDDEEFFYRVVERWNYYTRGTVMNPIHELSEKRRIRMKELAARFDEWAVLNAFDKLVDSEWLRGGGKNGFKATFDWITKQDNFEKLMNGEFDDFKKNN